MTKVAIILIGASGCGKSTVARKLNERFTGEGKTVAWFSLDECFFDLWESKHGPVDRADAAIYEQAWKYGKDNKAAYEKVVAARFNAALTADVVLFDTAAQRKKRLGWVEKLRAKGFQIWAVQVMTPLKVCLARQATRGDKAVPEGIVRSMYMMQQETLVPSDADILFVVDGMASTFNLSGELHFS